MSKFSNDLAENLYKRSLESLQSDQVGDVDGFGWFGLFHEDRAILEEDSSGFVYAHVYGSLAATESAWRNVVDDYWSWMEEEEDYRDYDYADDDNDLTDPYDIEFDVF